MTGRRKGKGFHRGEHWGSIDMLAGKSRFKGKNGTYRFAFGRSNISGCYAFWMIAVMEMGGAVVLSGKLNGKV
jgi:hypothetical protein